MLKIFSIFAILITTSDFGYSIVSHQTGCNISEPCVECTSTVNKFNNGYSEAQIPYQTLLVNRFNTFRNDMATKNNVSNMKYSIWMNGYHTLMKNMTLDIGEQNVTCTDRLTGSDIHFSVVGSIAAVNKAANEKELDNHVTGLMVSLINSNPAIVTRFDTSRFGCFFAVNILSQNATMYLLRCLFFTDIFISTRPISGSACTNCEKDDQCSVNYKGLCVSKFYTESNMGGGSTSNMNNIFNAILLLVISLKLRF